MPKKATARNAPAKAPRGAQIAAEVDDPGKPASVLIRGLTPADVAAVERAVARRQRRIDAVSPGLKLSQNSAMLALLRETCAREDAEDAAPKAST